MEKIKFFMEYDHQWIDHPLTVLFYINERLIHLDQGHKTTIINKKIQIGNGDQIFKIKIQNKNEANTIIDKNGNITKDSLIKIKNLVINDIKIIDIVRSNCKYYTQSKNTLPKVLDLGFNGEWQFNFSIPIYDWLLEKLF